MDAIKAAPIAHRLWALDTQRQRFPFVDPTGGHSVYIASAVHRPVHLGDRIAGARVHEEATYDKVH